MKSIKGGALDPSSIRELAEKEVNEKRTKEAVTEYKSKLSELEKATQIVRNIERDIADLEERISDGTYRAKTS